MEQLLVGLPEAAEALSVSKSTIKRMIHDGELDTVTIRRRRLVPVAELERFYVDLVEEATREDRSRSMRRPT